MQIRRASAITALGRPFADLGRDNPDLRRPKCAVRALLNRMVEEAYGYVQGASLKPYAAFLKSAYQLPDHQSGDIDANKHNSVEHGGRDRRVWSDFSECAD
jgi:hypothetical protein